MTLSNIIPVCACKLITSNTLLKLGASITPKGIWNPRFHEKCMEMSKLFMHGNVYPMQAPWYDTLHI